MADDYTERSLYQVMSDSEAKPPPIGEGTKARRRLDLRKYENKLRLRSNLAEPRRRLWNNLVEESEIFVMK